MNEWTINDVSVIKLHERWIIKINAYNDKQRWLILIWFDLMKTQTDALILLLLRAQHLYELKIWEETEL